MKILSEKEIEEAAKAHSDEFWGKNYITECKNYNEAGFNAGALFAEQKLLPFIEEFAEWIVIDHVKYAFKDGNEIWYDCIDNVYHTTQQLLEQFIKSRQNESTEMS